MPTSNYVLALATLIAANNVARVSGGDKCFNIDQIQQERYFSCNPSASTSTCCGSGWVCLSNGLCEMGALYTGVCTDPTWGNQTACPKICSNNVTNDSGVGSQVAPCGNGNFCCVETNDTNSNSTACCSTSSSLFSLAVATVVTTITNIGPTSTKTSSTISAASAAVSTQTFPCPDLDDTSYTDATGSSYNIECNTNYPGNDLPAVHADTFEECLRACDTYVPEPSAAGNGSCIGVSWGAGNLGGNCYLKYQITTLITNDDGLSSGYYISYTLPKSAVTIQGISASANMHTPTPSGGSDNHVAVRVGAGIGVPVGVALLAGVFYFIWRQVTTQPGGLLEVKAEANDDINNGVSEPATEREVKELPAKNNPGELSDPRGPRAEMTEIHGHRAEIA